MKYDRELARAFQVIRPAACKYEEESQKYQNTQFIRI